MRGRVSLPLLWVLVLAACTPVIQRGKPMPQPKTVELPAFSVIGLTTRTTNQFEMSGQGSRIGPLWREFQNGGGDLIPGVLDKAKTYSVYTNYESDHSGAYDVVLGRSVSDPQKAPTGMKDIQIPAGRYMVFPAAGSSPQAIQTAWMQVYDYFAQPTAPRRAFVSDFELYSPEGVSLYIGVR
jgi:predicted transcriptional regulator YdeE